MSDRVVVYHVYKLSSCIPTCPPNPIAASRSALPPYLSLVAPPPSLKIFTAVSNPASFCLSLPPLDFYDIIIGPTTVADMHQKSIACLVISVFRPSESTLYVCGVN